MAHWTQRQWFVGEIEAMKQVLAVCERWGYGNTMQVIANAWTDKFPSEGLTVRDCVAEALQRFFADEAEAAPPEYGPGEEA